jgi:ubiquinone/menaquinone biosynthesis C-methylase UbiE/peptidoglycan/xylan/chitin deacetylase (PgdA/CDA1 family)
MDLKNNFTIEEVASFWTKLGEKYDEANENFKEVHAQRYTEAIKYLELKPGDKILNIWSRTGKAIPFLRSKEQNIEIHNLEVSDSFLKIAGQKFPKETFAKTDLENLDFPDNYFDRILSLETLEHTPSPPKLLREFYRVLKPNGVLVMSLPPATAELAEKISRWFFGNHGEGPHKFLSSKIVKALLADAGFKLILHKGTLLIPFGPAWLMKLGEKIINKFQNSFISEMGIRQFYVAKKPLDKLGASKQICFSLDLEQDYGRIREYSSFALIPQLIELFKKYDLKLSVFAVARVLEEKPEIIKLFQDNLECEFHVHSYDHEINEQFSTEERKRKFEKAAEAYKKYFGKNPDGYRAPSGDLKDDEIGWLKELGFSFSSSFITTFRPGKFNNLNRRDKIFRHPNGLLEIPFSSLPFAKLPYSLGYFKVLGWPLVKFLIRRKKYDRPAVFAFHLHDLKKLDNLKKLPKPLYKLFYLLRNRNNGFKILEKFIKATKENGYESITISEIAKEIR